MTTDVAPPPRNVIAALAAVMAELPGIGKDQRAAREQGGYAYRGIEAITREAQPLLAKYGVVFVPRVIEHEVIDIVVNSRPWTDTRLMVAYDVYGPGGADDRITVGPIYAIGRDNSDKGANKALTQALKYAMLQVLCISDARDDADQGSPEQDVLGPDEIATAAGNLRRGPRVLEGWADIAEQREAHATFEAEAASHPEPVRVEIKAWRRDQGYDYPMTRAQLDQTREHLYVLADSFPEQAPLSGDLSAAEGAPSELPEGATDSSESDAHEDSGVVTASALPTSEEAELYLADARAALDRHRTIEHEVQQMPLERVREQLDEAGLLSTGNARVVRERLVDLLLEQARNPSTT